MQRRRATGICPAAVTGYPYRHGRLARCPLKKMPVKTLRFKRQRIAMPYKSIWETAPAERKES
ncbi:hypothetical protein HMPREF1548_06521 [Clostridium sp. KLE 1755]|nr:hypothetical protein HMPREF1548_06521 [Clostridium sp. KLE 1755]